MRDATLLCFAHGRDSEWEAICVDLDIAVTGRSLGEVSDLLERAVSSYIEDAKKESPETCKQLLLRRAPLRVELSLLFRMFISAVSQFFRRRNHMSEFEARFTIPCRA